VPNAALCPLCVLTRVQEELFRLIAAAKVRFAGSAWQGAYALDESLAPSLSPSKYTHTDIETDTHTLSLSLSLSVTYPLTNRRVVAGASVCFPGPASRPGAAPDGGTGARRTSLVGIASKLVVDSLLHFRAHSPDAGRPLASGRSGHIERCVFVSIARIRLFPLSSSPVVQSFDPRTLTCSHAHAQRRGRG
jgi:hypothetical protein